MELAETQPTGDLKQVDVEQLVAEKRAQTARVALRQWIADEGVSIPEAAEIFKISRSMLSMILSGNRNPSDLRKELIEVKTQGHVKFEDWF